MILPIVIIIAALYYYPLSNHSLGQYLNNRVLNSIKNVVESDSRFYIIGRLISELLIAIIICAIVLGIKKYRNETFELNFKYSSFFILIGLCGVLPIMITLEQRGFYMTTALPCFAIGLSILIASTLQHWIIKFESVLFKILPPITVVIFITLVTTLIFSYNQFVRNEESLSDIYKFGNIIPQKSTLGVAPDLYEDWGTGCYFQRFFFIEVNGNKNDWNKHKYVMINKSSTNNYIQFLSTYTKLNINTQLFDLYQRK
jgi:hypothetical protein